MKRSDVADLVIYLTQLQPAQKVDEYTADAWFDVLKDVPATLDEAREATAKVARKERWIFPGAIRGELISTKRPHELAAPAVERLALDRSPESDQARIERNRRGAEAAKAAVRRPAFATEKAEPLTEKEQRLKDALADYRAGQKRRTDPQTLGRAGGQVLSQINQARKALQ